MNPLKTSDVLRRVAAGYARIERERMHGCCSGTTPTQCLLLTELSTSGPMTLADLSRRTGLDKGWVSRAIELLSRKSMVRKESSQADGRVMILGVTGTGESVCCRMNGELSDLSERILSRIPSGDRDALMRTLPLLEQAIREEGEEQGTCSSVKC